MSEKLDYTAISAIPTLVPYMKEQESMTKTEVEKLRGDIVDAVHALQRAGGSVTIFAMLRIDDAPDMPAQDHLVCGSVTLCPGMGIRVATGFPR